MPKKKKQHKYTAEEILTMVKTKRESGAFSDLRTQLAVFWDLWRLVPYEAEKGHQAFTSTDPRSDANKILSGLNKASLTYQIQVPEDASPDDRESANKGEAILTGVLDRADRERRAIGEPVIRATAAWFATTYGALAGKCLIYNNENKESAQEICPVDPMHVTFDRGSKGLVWWANEYHIDKAEALDRYGIEISGDDAVIIDFFDRTNNAVVFSSGGAESTATQFVKELTPHELDHVPCFFGFAGDMPTVYDKEHKQTLQYRAQGVYAALQYVYPAFNKQVSFIMDAAEKSVAGTLKHNVDGGKKLIKGDVFSSFQVVTLDSSLHETLEAIDPPKVPPESAAILGILDREKQRLSVPFPIGYGQDTSQTPHSGTALSMLNDNMRSIYDPFSNLLANYYQWMSEEIFKQFKQKGQKINLKGFDTKGKFFVLDASPDDIKDDWYLKVTMEPKMPRDEAGELQMGLAASQGRPPFGRPLLSDLTILEDILHLQNPDAEDKRIEEQQIRRMIEQIPQIQVRRVANELLDKGDKEGARELLSALPAPGGQQGPPGQLGPQPGQPPQGPPQGGVPQGMMQPPGGPPQGPPQLSPQELEQVAAMAAQLKARGRPIPPEMMQVLEQAAQMPAPGGR